VVEAAAVETDVGAAAELEDEPEDDEPHPAVATATAESRTAGTLRIGPPSRRGLNSGHVRDRRVTGGYAQVSGR